MYGWFGVYGFNHVYIQTHKHLRLFIYFLFWTSDGNSPGYEVVPLICVFVYSYYILFVTFFSIHVLQPSYTLTKRTLHYKVNSEPSYLILSGCPPSPSLQL